MKELLDLIPPVYTMPKRIQRKRTKGWKAPAYTVYVGRPSRWGNPFGIASKPSKGSQFICSSGQEAANLFRQAIDYDPKSEHIKSIIRRELRGRHLMCWCRLDEWCHADVLLEIANGAASE